MRRVDRARRKPKERYALPQRPSQQGSATQQSGGASGSPDAPPLFVSRLSDAPPPFRPAGRLAATARRTASSCGDALRSRGAEAHTTRSALRAKAQERARARTNVKPSSQARQAGSKAQLRQRRNADRCRPLPAATGENPGDAHETTHDRRTEARDRRNAKTRTRQHAGVARDERSRDARSGGSQGRQSDAAGAHAAGARGKQDARRRQLHRKRAETRPARTTPIATSPQHARSLRCFT